MAEEQSPPSKVSSLKSPFLAFTKQASDLATLKQFSVNQGWHDTCVLEGDIQNAIEFLRNNPSPDVLLVELPSAAAAPSLLDQLADVCAPTTKVITTGSINEYSFYCWLMEIGIFSYLLHPLQENILLSTWAKTTTKEALSENQGKESGKVIGITGTRGGVGVSSLCVLLGALLAKESTKTVGLADLDPQDGSISLFLDLEPTHGLREALEMPDRIDTLFLDRLMTKAAERLYVLSTEDTLNDKIIYHEHAADILIGTLKEKFNVTILDLPRGMNSFTRGCVRTCDVVLLVCEPTLQSLRDAMRLHDFFRDTLKTKPPVCVLNRLNMAVKFEMSKADFEKGLNAEIAHSIPFAPEIFMKMGAELPALKNMSSPAMKNIHALAASILPEINASAETTKKKSTSPFKKK